LGYYVFPGYKIAQYIINLFTHVNTALQTCDILQDQINKCMYTGFSTQIIKEIINWTKK